MKVKDFEKVAIRYKTIFFDAFGVLKNHKGIIPGVERTFDFLDENGINYFVLTNDSSRGPEGLADGYIRRGIKSLTPDKIISSGMLARDWLALKMKKGTVAYLGTGDSAHYIETAGNGLETLAIRDIDLNNTDHIKCLVFLDDEGFDWNHDINKVINLLRKQNMPVVVANTDIHYPVNKNDVAVAIGGISDLVEEILGKQFIRFGKPDAQMFMFAYERACEVKPVKKSEILMVGDTLYTDIIGGNKYGVDTALVLSGNTLPEMAKVRITSSGIIPNHICESVVIR